MNTNCNVYVLKGPGINEHLFQETCDTLKKHLTNSVIAIDYSYLTYYKSGQSNFRSYAEAVLVVGGGNAVEQKTVLESTKTVKKISEFVRQGNHYLGICAGSYLIPSLDLVSADYEAKAAMRPNQKLRIRPLLTTENLDKTVQKTSVIYFGGPEFIITDNTVNVLASYNDSEDKINKPAIIEADYGMGKFLLTSHHWELSTDFIFDKFKDFYHSSLDPVDLPKVVENFQQSNDLITRLFLSRLDLDLKIPLNDNQSSKKSQAYLSNLYFADSSFI
jgi:glutamine amidotransferase-like uncharacterized protein